MLDDLSKLGPVLVMAAVAAAILVWDFLPKGKPFPAPRGRTLMLVALAGPVGALLWALALTSADEGFAFANSMVVDEFTLFFTFLFAGISAAVILSSESYSRRFEERQAEYFSLLLFATSAMMLMAASRDLVLIFVALELTSISQYIMAAIQRDRRSAEAGVKYLLLGAVSSAIILYGMTLLFGLTGTTRIVGPPGEPSIASALAGDTSGIESILLVATVFLIAGLGFKMAVVPFQMWVPDVYEGAPAPVGAFLSVASKAAAFAVVLRIFFEGMANNSLAADWADVFAVVAAVSMTLGNVLALNQTNIKRLLGYSSIAQAGNFAVGLAAVSAGDGMEVGASSVIFFLAAYAATNLAAFTVVIAVSDRTGGNGDYGDYAGLFKRSPLLAVAMAFALVSLTGIPPTAGFVAKLYIFNAAVESDLVWLVIVAVLNSVVSAFYYLRVVSLMFVGEPENDETVATTSGLKLALATSTALIVIVGVAPTPLLNAAKDAASVLAQ